MKINKKIPKDIGVVVVAQLVERLLPTPEVPDSNPVIGNVYLEKMKIKKKEARMTDSKNS